MKSIINGKKRTFYTESGSNLVPMAFPPMPFSKKNVLGTRLGVIVVDVSYSRFAPPVARNLKNLDAEGSRRVRLNSQQPCPHICRRGLLDKISLFFCFDIVFIKSSKMPPDCCFFCFCVCFFCIYTVLTNVLHLISPFLTYLTIHPLSPLFHLYFYKHLYLRG